MRAWLYDILSIGLSLVSIFLFYRMVTELAEKDYVASAFVVIAGFATLRLALEFGRFGIWHRRRERDEAPPSMPRRS